MSPRNDDVNDDENGVPVWTRRRPTGFDVMPEGTRRDEKLSFSTRALFLSLPFAVFLFSLFKTQSNENNNNNNDNNNNNNNNI